MIFGAKLIVFILLIVIIFVLSVCLGGNVD